MIIKTIAETSYSGMYKVAPGEGAAFFIRKEYLPSVPFELLDCDVELNEQQTDEVLDGALACVVELKAVGYLARAEQSRFGLTRKLTQKGFDKKYIDMALTYLESAGYLSDSRYAEAWLNTRKIGHYEGRGKLLAELQSRGISKEIAGAAVDEFFKNNDETAICIKAYEKFVKKGKTEDKLVAVMMQSGFSYRMIKEAREAFEQN